MTWLGLDSCNGSAVVVPPSRACNTVLRRRRMLDCDLRRCDLPHAPPACTSPYYKGDVPPPTDSDPIQGPHLVIQLQDIHKAFGDKSVLEGFSLEVSEGETMVIIGYSGTGKSVAIKHIVGLLEPDAGRVIVDDLVVGSLSRRELYRLRARIGYVFQFAALFDSLSIGENVAMGLRKQGQLSDAEIVERVQESLDLVDLPDAAERFPAELSGGMRKRVGIARAIALRPKYLLYDEPTTGLDPVTSAVIDELMIRMREKVGVTSIVITHDMRSAYRVGTRIAMLYEGRVRRVGTVDEIQHTTDPVVRQFIEGKAHLEANLTGNGADRPNDSPPSARTSFERQ